MRPEEVQDEIARRVAVLRQEGRYPLGLEEQLEAEFAAIMDVVHGRRDLPLDLDAEVVLLRAMVEELRGRTEASHIEPDGDGVASVALLALEQSVKLYEILLKEFENMRREDERIIRRLEHFIRDRIVMVDVLAHAVTDLERRLDQRK